MLEPSKIGAFTENSVESRKNHPGAPTGECSIDFTTVESNAFSIMFAVTQALKKAGASKEYCQLVREDMMGGDYVRLLGIAMAEVNHNPED